MTWACYQRKYTVGGSAVLVPLIKVTLGIVKRHYHKKGVRERSIIRTDLQIRTTFEFVLTHPPTPKSEHSRQKNMYTLELLYFLKNFLSTDNLNLTSIHEKIFD